MKGRDYVNLLEANLSFTMEYFTDLPVPPLKAEAFLQALLLEKIHPAFLFLVTL